MFGVFAQAADANMSLQTIAALAVPILTIVGAVGRLILKAKRELSDKLDLIGKHLSRQDERLRRVENHLARRTIWSRFRP